VWGGGFRKRELERESHLIDFPSGETDVSIGREGERIKGSYKGILSPHINLQYSIRRQQILGLYVEPDPYGPYSLPVSLKDVLAYKVLFFCLLPDFLKVHLRHYSKIKVIKKSRNSRNLEI
jgi:hypothetical protein